MKMTKSVQEKKQPLRSIGVRFRSDQIAALSRFGNRQEFIRQAVDQALASKKAA